MGGGTIQTYVAPALIAIKTQNRAQYNRDYYQKRKDVILANKKARRDQARPSNSASDRGSNVEFINARLEKT